MELREKIARVLAGSTNLGWETVADRILAIPEIAEALALLWQSVTSYAGTDPNIVTIKRTTKPNA